VKIVFLGTGSSVGVPVPTCNCNTCLSVDPRDKRLRSSIFIDYNGVKFVIDCGPDFRQQVLTNSITRIDFLLITHKHNDHVGGLDDVRTFNYIQKQDMPLFGNEESLDDIKRRFYYSFEKRPYPGTPKFELIALEKGKKFIAGGLSIMPIEVMHGSMSIFGYRIGDFTYITDAKDISEDQIELIKGSKYLVVNALLPDWKHKMHFDLEDALSFISLISPEKAWLTHMSHKFPFSKELKALVPDNVEFAYDGLTIEI